MLDQKTTGAGLAIEYRPLAALIPYARNARTHSEAQVALIAGSIREYGFTNPVLVDGENGIIAGHGRVLAARKLGLDPGAGDRARPSQRGAEARLHPRRQPARRAGRLGPRAAGAGGRRTSPELGVDLGALGFEAAEIDALLQRRRARPARGGDPGAARRPGLPARRPLAARAASAALRQRHRPADVARLLGGVRPHLHGDAIRPMA